MGKKQNTKSPAKDASSKSDTTTSAKQPVFAVAGVQDKVDKLHDRFLFVLACLKGRKVKVSIKDSCYIGILHAVDTQGLGIVLRYAKNVVNDVQLSPLELRRLPYTDTVTIAGSEITCIECAEAPVPHHAKASLKSAAGFTDSDIASRSSVVQGDSRAELVPWQAETVPGVVAAPLRDEAYRDGSWDQFKANEELFKLGESTYSDEKYTTPLVSQNDPEYRNIMRKAEEHYRSMKNGMRGRRGSLGDDGDSGANEEERFSAVVRPAQAPHSPRSPEYRDQRSVDHSSRPRSRDDYKNRRGSGKEHVPEEEHVDEPKPGIYVPPNKRTSFADMARSGGPPRLLKKNEELEAENPAESKPTEQKPAQPKPEAKPVEQKPAQPKPVEAKPVEPKPVEPKPVEQQKPTEVKPVEAKPVETTPVEQVVQPVEAPARRKPKSTMTISDTPAAPVEQKPKPVEQKLAEQKPTDTKPVVNHVESQPAERTEKDSPKKKLSLNPDAQSFTPMAPPPVPHVPYMYLPPMMLPDMQYTMYGMPYGFYPVAMPPQYMQPGPMPPNQQK